MMTTPPLLLRTSPAGPLLEHLLGPLSDCFDAPIEDIAINGPDEGVWIFQRGRWEHREIRLDLEWLEEIAVLTGAIHQKDVGAASPICDERLPNGARLNICMAPAVDTGKISLTFRRHSATGVPLNQIDGRYRTDNWRAGRQPAAERNADLIARYRDPEVDFKGFLAAAVAARRNILLCGDTGSGKTTLATSAILDIPHSRRVITVEDAAELVIEQPNNVRLLLGSVEYEPLLKSAMRMRPDHVLLQEIREPEAAWAYVAERGHRGTVTTLHGDTPAGAVRRLFQLGKASKAGGGDDATLLDMIEAVTDLIVPLSKDGGTFEVGPIWFAAEARERGETIRDLLRED